MYNNTLFTPGAPPPAAEAIMLAVKQNHLLYATSYYNAGYLPRQARDKHRESLKHSDFFSQAGTRGNAYSTTEHLTSRDYPQPVDDAIQQVLADSDVLARAANGGGVGLRLGGFGCAAPGSTPPAVPTFLPPFENCHC